MNINLNRKVTDLESNVLSDNITDDTCFNGLSEVLEAEQELHRHDRKIIDATNGKLFFIVQ